MSESDKSRQKYVAMGYPVGTAFPVGIPDPEPADPPFEGKLTIVWEQEKTEILKRLELCEKQIIDLTDRLELRKKQDGPV